MLFELAPNQLGNRSEYSVIESPYLCQVDSSSCGLIIVLAFYYAYTDTALFGEHNGSTYDPSMHSNLIHWYIYHF